MQESSDETLSSIAGKSVKEMAYHARHAGEWVVRLGDGSEESHRRLAAALEELWPYTHELFMTDAADEAMIAAGIIPDVAALKPAWEEGVAEVLAAADLSVPEIAWQPEGGRRGVHSGASGLYPGRDAAPAAHVPGGEVVSEVSTEPDVVGCARRLGGAGDG